MQDYEQVFTSWGVENRRPNSFSEDIQMLLLGLV